MAHHIENHDKVQGLKRFWHGLNEIVEKIILSQSCVGMWEVEKSRMLHADGSESDYCELVCSDNRKIVIGSPVHCETYVPITNKAFLDCVQDTLDRIPGSIVESVGSVRNRGRIFVSISVPKVKEIVAAGRKIEPYLSFLSSHDLSCAFCANASGIMTVCDNTFGMNLHDKNNAAFRVYLKHTKNVIGRVENVPAMVDAYYGTIARFKSILDGLADIPVNENQAECFFAGLLTVKDDNEAKKLLSNRPEIEISTRRENQIDRLSSLFVSGKGNRGQDRSDLYGAVTDYYTHESSGGDDMWKQVETSEYGAGANMKSRVLSILPDSQRFNQLVNVGQYVLS